MDGSDLSLQPSPACAVNMYGDCDFRKQFIKTPPWMLPGRQPCSHIGQPCGNGLCGNGCCIGSTCFLGRCVGPRGVQSLPPWNERDKAFVD